MFFPLHIASDIDQEKVNLEVPFTSKPGIDAICAAAETLFTAELEQARGGRQGAGAARFGIGRVQIYDDEAMQWVDLVSGAQLHPYDQLYAFPADLSHVGQQRRELPPPRIVTFPNAASSASANASTAHHQSGLSEARGGSVQALPMVPGRGTIGDLSAAQPRAAITAAHRSVSAAAPEDKVSAIYALLDARGQGYVTPTDFAQLLGHHGVLFSASAIHEIFAAVNDHAGHWGLSDVRQWSRMYPATFAALCQRVFLAQREAEMQAALRGKESSVQHLNERTAELRRLLQEAEEQLAADQRAQAKIGEDLRALRQRRGQDEEEEQVVLDKEVSVQHQRALLRREERAFEEMAHRRGLLGDGHGSDRHHDVDDRDRRSMRASSAY